jgi:hypothetical protein
VNETGTDMFRVMAVKEWLVGLPVSDSTKTSVLEKRRPMRAGNEWDSGVGFVGKRAQVSRLDT